jgi:hypothetical protein
MNFLDLFNAVAKVARPAHHKFEAISSMNEKFEDSCLDSMDLLMVGMYMSIIYDIEDEISKDWQPETAQEMHDLIMAHKKRDPESIEQALEMIK